MCLKKLNRLFIAVLCIALTAALALGISFTFKGAEPALANEAQQMTVESLTADANSKYLNTQFKNTYEVKTSQFASYSTNGGERSGNELSKGLDGNGSTYWISQTAITDTEKIYIDISLKQRITFKGVVYKSAYYSPNNVRHFSGYPTVLNVYTAIGDGELTLSGVCASEPQRDFSEEVVFLLPTAIECDIVRIEFADVSVYQAVYDGAAIAAARDMALFRSDDGVIQTVKSSGNLDNNAFLASSSVMSSEMKIRANGGGTAANAFDKSQSTYWTSESYNTSLFSNKITLIMDAEQTVSDIVYACSYYSRGNTRNFSGFPTTLKVTATQADGSQQSFTFMGAPANDWRLGVFKFPHLVKCVRLELDFKEVTVFSEVAEGKPVVSCAEIYVVKGNSEDLTELTEQINSIFTDYAQYEIKKGVTVNTISNLRDKAVNTGNYEQAFKPILDRAEAILTAVMKKDIYREFSTDPNAKNVIEQNGNLVNYCRNTLQLTSFGTNRQVIGIGGTAGETITIYVEADENDPLPQVAFTQIYGAWNSWMRTYSLHLGKNEIVFPNFKAGGSYTRPVEAGGPIHIINPYTPAQQSSNVKVYIEGGYVYPVFHDRDDEGTFKIILKDYYERLKDPNDSSITIDAFEAVTGNVILSCTATLAYNSYVRSGTSPQYNIDKWRQYTIDTLKFGGIEFEEGKPYYDKRNHYIKANYRIVQPFAGMYAFAANEHIGIIDSGTFGAMVQKWTIGWAFYHEFGHMLDNKRMKIPEVTNNMWSIYNIYMVDNSFNNRINVSNVSARLASDFSAKKCNFYGNGNDNCDFWWIIEGASPGYWAKLQQLYCFSYNLASNISDSTEKLCYFSSLATGVDMCDYFTRWGFYFTSGKFNFNNKFTYEKTSQQFKDALAAAKADGKVVGGENKKFWYVDNNQYRYTKIHGGTIDASWASCYNSSQTVEITDVMGSSSGYTLLLPTPENAEAHLCYEIQSYIDNKWQVVGVTYGSSFTDTYAYGEGVTPKYKVYAYDRMFNRTGDPAEEIPQIEAQTDVCRRGEIRYNSLKEAVAAAQSGDTIWLLKDFKDGGIVIDHKNLNIVPDPAIFGANDTVTITKNATGHLFKISECTVNFGTSSNSTPTSARIIMDGNSFVQSGSLVYIPSGARVAFSNVVFQNNYNTSSGGGLWIDYTSNVYFNGCTIQNNRGSDGGGIFLRGRSGVSLRRVDILNNTATSRGGALCELEYTGTSTFHNNDKIGGAYTAVNIIGNKAANGGAIYTQNNVSLHNAQIKNNSATANGGAIYTDIDNTGRSIALDGCTVSDNTADNGSAIFMYRGKTSLSGCKIAGTIYKAYGTSPAAKFEFRTALSDMSECEIRLSSAIPRGGLVLCENVSGLNVDAFTAAVRTYNVLNGHAEFVSGVGVKVFPKEATLTVNYGTESFETSIPWGKFTLPERFDGLPENKYIEKYVIDGQEKNVGDNINVTHDLAATVTVADYKKVALRYGSHSENLLLKHGTVYYLPMKTPYNEVVFGWNCSNGKYYAYAEGVEITKDLVFTAVIKRLNTVTTIIDTVSNTAEYEYGSSVTLASPPAMFGKVFSHWDIDGKKYQANQTVKVTRDIVATAVYTDSWQVTTVIEDEEITMAYPNGYVIALENIDAALGREFKYWLINGNKYYAGSTYTVTCDSEIFATFAQINYAAPITITLIVNKGAIEGDTASVEPITTTLNYHFNDKHTFTTPDVNVGNKFLYWEINGVKYNSGSEITITEALTATAVVVPINEIVTAEEITVSIKDYFNGTIGTTEYHYTENSTIFLPLPVEQPANKAFAYWVVNDRKYAAGSTVTLTENASVEAVYYNTVKVNINQYVFGELTDTVWQLMSGTNYTLSAPKNVPEGLEFVCWEVNGVKRNVGYQFTVNEDTQVKAIYKNLYDYGNDDNVDSNGGNKKPNAGLIAGIVVPVAVVLAAGVTLTVLLIKKKKAKASAADSADKKN